jgi:hypothetical protein
VTIGDRQVPYAPYRLSVKPAFPAWLEAGRGTVSRVTVVELRAFVLSLPDAIEASHQGRPDFRVAGKIMVNLDEDDRVITIKLDLDEQAALLGRADGAFGPSGGWAKHGWTDIHLDAADDEEVRELITDAWDRVRQPARRSTTRGSAARPRGARPAGDAGDAGRRTI